MKLNKSKKGISLIVLVITIIVMIILATAIILSLNTSNISGKANEAKLSSDMSNKKEAASVYLSEYYINVAKGKINADTTSANDYVRAELRKAGLDTSDVLVTEEGDILVGIAAMFVNNNVPISTIVEGYKIGTNDTNSYETSGGERDDGTKQTIERVNSITWKYMGLDDNDNVMIVADVESSLGTIRIDGKRGFIHALDILNSACEKLYSSSMGIARNINYEDVLKLLKYNGPMGTYYDKNSATEEIIDKVLTIEQLETKLGTKLSNRKDPLGEDVGKYELNSIEIDKDSEYINASNDIIDLVFQQGTYTLATKWCYAHFMGGFARFDIPSVTSSSIWPIILYYSYGGDGNPNYSISLRPVVTLNSNVSMTFENGIVKVR